MAERLRTPPLFQNNRASVCHPDRSGGICSCFCDLRKATEPSFRKGLASLLPRATASLTPQILSPSGLADELPLRYDQFPARVNVLRIALHLESFKHRVIHPHVMRRGGD